MNRRPSTIRAMRWVSLSGRTLCLLVQRILPTWQISGNLSKSKQNKWRRDWDSMHVLPSLLESEWAIEASRHTRKIKNFDHSSNEDYQVAEAEQLGWDPSDDNPENWLKTRFPARYLYEKLLPEVVKEATSVFYHPGSPWKTGSNTRDTTKGDIHQWNVWHGTQEPYQNWDKLGGRFVSEFGMHALPDLRTIDQYLEYKNIERYPLSKTVQMHNKAGGGQSRLEHYLITNFRHDMDMQSYIYASQLMQAECLASAYAVWRRMWKGEGREYCGGTAF